MKGRKTLYSRTTLPTTFAGNLFGGKCLGRNSDNALKQLLALKPLARHDSIPNQLSKSTVV
jgi:hypothetical protein